MAENMMNTAHKTTNKKYRDNYDRIFRAPKKSKKDGGKNGRTSKR
jgi:hypothetical protein